MINEAQRVARRLPDSETMDERRHVLPLQIAPLLIPRREEPTELFAPPASAPRFLDSIRPRDPEKITVQIADTPALMETVYRLRHDSYVAQGFLEPRSSGLFFDEWDGQPNFFSMLGYMDDRPAMSVRISHCQPAAPRGERTATTAMELYEAEIENLAAQFKNGTRPTIVMEMSRLTRHPDFSETNSDPMFGIFRANFYCLVKTEADILISAVRRHHMPFYKRLGFQKITEPRPYPKLKFETALMACFRPSYDAIQNSIPIFQGIRKTDSVYANLFAGERVRIFEGMPGRGVVR